MKKAPLTVLTTFMFTVLRSGHFRITQPLCQALNGLSAVTVPIFPDLHHPSRRLMVVGSPECIKILQSRVLGAWESLREEPIFEQGPGKR